MISFNWFFGITFFHIINWLNYLFCSINSNYVDDCISVVNFKNQFETMDNNIIILLLFIAANWGEGYRGSVTWHFEWSGSQSQCSGGHRRIPTGQFYWSALKKWLNFLLLSLASGMEEFPLLASNFFSSHFCKTFNIIYLLLYFWICWFYVIKSSWYSKL